MTAVKVLDLRPDAAHTADDIKVSDVRAHALIHTLAKPSITSWGTYTQVSSVLVEIRTDAGLVGVGECLGRFAAPAYVELIQSLYKPMLVGRSVFDIGLHAAQLRRAFSGKAGGIAAEAMSGIDIALWDIVGKAAGLPLYKLFGGAGRTSLDAYASSIDWGDDALAQQQIEALVERRFRGIKLKIGHPVKDAVKRAEFARRIVGDEIDLYADANWAYRLPEAITVADALAANGFGFFEEPVAPEDIEGYRQLRSKARLPLAAGESDFNTMQMRELIAERILDVIQPNITRHGGISGVRRTVALASAFGVDYATHVGFSGIVCEAASLHVAAAADNFLLYEVGMSPSPFREGLSDHELDLRDGRVAVPQGPGLGIEMDWDAVARLAPGQ